MSKKYKKRGKYTEVRPVPTDAEINAILEDIKPEVALEALVADAKAYLDYRNPELNAIDATEEELLALRTLAGGTPEPLIDKNGRMEQRTFLEYETNPITGEQEIVGYRDPADPKYVLRANIGQFRDPRTGKTDALPFGHTKAAEYLGEIILKLTGAPAVLNNQTRLANGREATWRADLRDPQSDRNIDVEVKEVSPGYFERHFPQQVYTGVTTTDASQIKLGQMMGKVERAIEKEARTRDVNIVDAVENLIDRGVFENTPRQYMKGKALKSNINQVASEADIIHDILVPGLRPEQLDLGKKRGRGWNNEGTLVQAPSTIQLVDNAKALEYIQTKMDNRNLKPGKYNEGPLRMRPSFGDVHMQGREGKPRVRVYADLPNDATIRGQQVARNLVKEHPILEQILDERVMRFQ